MVPVASMRKENVEVFIFLRMKRVIPGLRDLRAVIGESVDLAADACKPDTLHSFPSKKCDVRSKLKTLPRAPGITAVMVSRNDSKTDLRVGSQQVVHFPKLHLIRSMVKQISGDQNQIYLLFRRIRDGTAESLPQFPLPFPGPFRSSVRCAPEMRICNMQESHTFLYSYLKKHTRL